MPGLIDTVLEKLREIYHKLESPALKEVVERAELEEYEDKVVVRVPDEYCKFAFLKEIYPLVKRELQVSLLVLTPSEDVIFELSPKYTFKNFIVGKGNLLAVRACQVAIENLRKKSIPYNPIFIYGRVGVGKTHLLQATGNKALERGFKVVYRSSIDFAEEVVSAIKENSLSYLRDFYKTVDVLLIDDIQFMAGKERTQLEFFNIFNHLYQNNKLVVIASDRHPKKLRDVMDRLINRFEGGLVVELKLDEITKKAIIKEKLIIYGLPVDQNIIDYIAQNTGDNVREIEGFIAQLKAKESLNLKPSEEKYRQVSPEEVVKEVSTFYGVSRNKILKKTRNRKISLIRQIAMYLTRQVCGLPLAKVGEIFGVSDHTSVLYAIKKIEKLKRENPQIGEEIEFLKTKLLEG
ncbi:MAG: chromosomal replication initiator protein DnaA [Aquificaceae bacterium]|nr:MAG: chromosomal replication initiator protein DnaA [Aquificaceae bacterium]